jgi:hypothetical protein
MSSEGSKAPRPKQPDEEQKRVPPHLMAFLASSIAAMKPLLRPSARRDMFRFVVAIRSEAKAKEFLAWASRVLEANRVDGRSGHGGRAARAIQETPLPVFRRPDRAYRPRSIF